MENYTEIWSLPDHSDSIITWSVCDERLRSLDFVMGISDDPAIRMAIRETYDDMVGSGESDHDTAIHLLLYCVVESGTDGQRPN